jgi:formate--tetrahydrofolate ligase
VVLVATVRALKYHGGVELAHLAVPNAKALARGLENLTKQIENVRLFHLTPIVAINRFATDTDEEHQVILDHCQFMGVQAAVMEAWEKGGEGAEELAELVAATADQCNAHYKPLYDWKQSVREKIEIIATRVYGAASVEYAPGALKDLEKVKQLGLEGLPVCIAKTQSSLSDQPGLRGRPRDFVATVREVEIASGARFLVPITGNMMRMPGLPEVPSAEKIDIDEKGVISGLF